MRNPDNSTLPEKETKEIIERAHFESNFSLLDTPFLRQQFIRRIGRVRFNELAYAHEAVEALKVKTQQIQTRVTRKIT